MKTRHIIFCALLLAGCTSTPQPQKKTMTAQEATPTANEIVAAYFSKLTAQEVTQLARDAANAEAEANFKCRPFHHGVTVQLADGGWAWHDRVGVGHADMEARVRFHKDGSGRSVEVLLLDNMELSMSRW